MKRGEPQVTVLPNKDEAIACAVRVSDPGDEIYIHGELCKVDPSTGIDCTCTPMIHRVGAGA